MENKINRILEKINQLEIKLEPKIGLETIKKYENQ